MRLSGGGVLFEHYRGLDKNALEAVNNNSNSGNCATSVQPLGFPVLETGVFPGFIYKTQSSEGVTLPGFGPLGSEDRRAWGEAHGEQGDRPQYRWREGQRQCLLIFPIDEFNEARVGGGASKAAVTCPSCTVRLRTVPHRTRESPRRGRSSS